jgi:HK97 family phage major capsid protein
VYRIPQTEPVSPSRTRLEQIQLDAKTLVGLTFASERLVTDSFPALAAMLDASFRDEFAGRQLEERIWGTGVGEFTGVMRVPALITIPKEEGQADNTIVWQNIVNMRARCWGFKRAVWLATQEAVPQLTTLTVPVGDGGAHVPAWQAGSDEDGVPDQLLGRPLYYSSDVCSPLGDLGDLMLINWSQYLDATYRPVEAASSIHVRYAAIEEAFRFILRSDGAPWWRSALTPRRSTTTLSPYVTLAPR